MNKGNCKHKQNCHKRQSTKTQSNKNKRKESMNHTIIQPIVEKKHKYLYDRTKSIDSKHVTIQRNNQRNTKYSQIYHAL